MVCVVYVCVCVLFALCEREKEVCVLWVVCVCVRTRGAEVYLLDEKVVCWVLGTVYCGFDVRNFVASFLFLGRYSRRRKKSLLCVCVCVWRKDHARILIYVFVMRLWITLCGTIY